MKEFLLKIFTSEIMYYVVVPIVVFLLEWIKSERDLKEKNKELGYWMMKCRKSPTFPDIAFKIYKMMAINLIVVYVVRVMLYLWKNGKIKGVLALALYLIYGIPFFFELYGNYVAVVEIIFGILLSAWVVCLFKFCDVVFILDNRYADIFVKGSESAQFAEAGSIMKHGEWIIVNGYDEEIRIKESDIVRIDYYGGPMIMVEKCKLFQKR